MVLAGSTGTSSSGVGISCGPAAPFDHSAPLGRAVAVRDVLWLGIYPFDSGYPTKTNVMAQRSIRGRIVLRGWNCATGSKLRFWYREGPPFEHLPVTSAALRHTGSLGATFGPWPAKAMRGGYLMFWRAGLWKIVAYQDSRWIGTAIVRAARD
jgi:hypothetical protein